jgi:hypothetical protein
MLREWLAAYYKWLTGSDAGHEAMAATNNLGSWYDVQAVRIALYLGRTNEIRRWLETHRKRRIGWQIDPDGRQPNELARTRPLNYSIMNLEALFALARLAEQVGVDWWGYETADGRSLRGALQFLAPYADPEKPWRREEVTPTNRSALLPSLAEGALRWPDGKFQQFLRRAPSDPSATWILLYGPEFAPQPSGKGSTTAAPAEPERSGRSADAAPVRP